MYFAFYIAEIFQPSIPAIFLEKRETLNWCWKGNNVEYFFLAHQHPIEWIWQTCETWENSWMLAVKTGDAFPPHNLAECSVILNKYHTICHHLSNQLPSVQEKAAHDSGEWMWKWDAAFLVFFWVVFFVFFLHVQTHKTLLLLLFQSLREAETEFSAVFLDALFRNWGLTSMHCYARQIMSV